MVLFLKSPVLYYDNPLLNSIIYEIEFPDRQIKKYTANVIAENILSQIDTDGFATVFFDNIIDYKKSNNTVNKSDRYLYDRKNRKRLKQTTVGQKLLVVWKDGSESWIPLKDLKKSNPVEISEFAKTRNINNKPAFAWWVLYTLRKRDIIIDKLKTRVRKTTHKYSIQVPTSVKNVYKINKTNRDIF